MRQLVLSVLLALTAIRGRAQDSYSDTKSSDERNVASSSASNDAKVPLTTATMPADPSYVIGADDMLLISVWKEPEASVPSAVRSSA